MDWTDAVILSLRALWDEGLSTAEIGRRLGVTKNAVVGKAHRLDLPARPSPIRRGVAPAAPRRATGPTLPSMEQPDAAPPSRGQDERPGSQPAPRAHHHPGDILLSPQPAPARAAGPVPGVVAANSATPVAARTPAAATAPEDGPAAPASPPRLVPVRAAAAVRPAAAPRRQRVVPCCWPIGEPGTRSFRFCDAESMAGKPYCDTHAQLAYVKVRDRREDAA